MIYKYSSDAGGGLEESWKISGAGKSMVGNRWFQVRRSVAKQMVGEKPETEGVRQKG